MFGQIPATDYDLRFSLRGIPVRVHPVFWLTAAFLSWNRSVDFADQLDTMVVRMLCIFIAILVHELGHALMTRAFGWQPEVVLYFFGGYATSMRHSTWRDIAVSAAGPLAGFSLYFLVLSVVFLVPSVEFLQHPLVLDALGFSLFINLIWNAVNLLPVSPLDGGQIIRELFQWISPRRGLETSLLLSMLVAGAVALWSFYSRANGQAVLGLDPLFLGIMFGLLSYQSYQQYQYARNGYW